MGKILKEKNIYEKIYHKYRKTYMNEYKKKGTHAWEKY
jgi:hypothetical protein